MSQARVLHAARAELAWPWRGLGLACLLAVLMHVLAWMLASGQFVFSFQNPNSTRERVSVRLIDPLPALPALPAALPQPASPPPSDANISDAKATPLSAAAAPLSTNQEPTLPPPDSLPKFEPNQPLAGINTAQNATKTIAYESASDDNPLPPAAAPTGGTPTPPGIKLLFPPSVQLQFDSVVMRNGQATEGSGELVWKSDGSSYEMRLEVSQNLLSSRTEKSVGKISVNGLAPERYSSASTGRSEQATHFRAELGKIQFSNNKPEEVLLTGAQDRLSALIQLAGIIGGDTERYRIVNRIRMQVAELDAAQVWEFKLEGVSDINLPAANMQVLKLTREPRNEYDLRLEIWLSPPMGYLPVRIRQSSPTTPALDFTDLLLRKMP